MENNYKSIFIVSGAALAIGAIIYFLRKGSSLPTTAPAPAQAQQLIKPAPQLAVNEHIITAAELFKASNADFKKYLSGAENFISTNNLDAQWQKHTDESIYPLNVGRDVAVDKIFFAIKNGFILKST